LSIIETFSPVEKRARLFEEPLPSRTPKVFFERLITCGRPDLFSAVPAKRDTIFFGFDLPNTHSSTFVCFRIGSKGNKSN
jgi:hypothetical protein